MNVMDLSPMLNEFDTPFLVDSGTESFTESPVAEEESQHFEESAVSDTDSSNSNQKTPPQLHILDKDVSVDEDVLIAPLVPTRNSFIDCANSEGAPPIVAINDNPVHDEQNLLHDELVLTSILRRESTSSNSPRKVSFPEHLEELATYREPETNPPWMISTYLPAEKILQVYQSSCKQHQTIELDIIKSLILDIKDNTNHSAVLNLSMVNITTEVNETLEALLKVSNFRTITLNECKFTPETISEFLNMLEYYESVCEIDIAMSSIDVEAWKCFCNACSNIMVLESISFKGMNIYEDYMRMLLNAIKKNPRITILKFDSCTLQKLPSFYLVDQLMSNTTIRELYLPSTGLYTKEADCLGRFLQRNHILTMLDISNNFIGDRGLDVLAKGLTKQTVVGCGLSVLVIVNNQLSEKSGSIISNIIRECKNLHTLNIGYNNLTDEVLSDIKSSLETTKSLEGLGLHSTVLTCKGIDFLAEAIKNNTSLQKINLKGNKAIQVAGLEKLCQALTTSKIFKIEIDSTNRFANDPQAYVQLVKKINAICTVNKGFKDTSSDEISKLLSRKVSLSCEPRFIIPEPSTYQVDAPILAPVSSRPPTPAPKSRFHITKVEDRSPMSRFKVIPVPTDDEKVPAKFANVRSSVSSNDSVDSLQLDTDSD